MRITAVSYDRVAETLPDVQELEADLRDYDVLICAAGFEDRATHITERVRMSSASIATAIILDYDSNTEDNARKRDELVTLVTDSANAVHIINDRGTEADFDSRLQTLLPSNARILFDVSASSGTYLLRVMRALFGHARSHAVDVDIAYASALDYKPSHEEAEALIKRLDDGEATEGTTLGLDFDADENAHVIAPGDVRLEPVSESAVVICGFNADRVAASLDKIDTSFNIDKNHPDVKFISGHPPRARDEWRYGVMNRINGHRPSQKASTLHYQETLRHLEAAYAATEPRSRLTVLPFGSKMQSIAVALFAEAHSDVRVQMLPPVSYGGAGYSHGVGETYLLSLGDLGRLSRTVRSINALCIEEDEDKRPRTTAVTLTDPLGGVI
ncbi:hypothetical protein LJR042_002579 [Microbacterium maritypicum]|uniref:hypothetical protein n=1 Tax=Microbacterium TaxID=33882 RepID=UPI0014200FB7|nr:hypothetical protein [Microbacterium sp. Be9]NIG66426.1 hypothetical protein [Microbacterium sp. Be9]